MNEILKAERLSKTYGKSIAVSEVSLTVRQGDIYGLIGKNGAGKTTFMRMVLGLASPDSGQMELFGKTDLEQQRKHIGSLIEEPGRYPGMSARDNLEIIRRNFLVILIIGLILIGTQQTGSSFFQNLFIYFGLQLLFGVAVSSIVIAVCEWSRNMAAGIGITMALIIFSPLLMRGLDLLFSAMQLKIAISGYWILNLMADCPTEAFTSEFYKCAKLNAIIIRS